MVNSSEDFLQHYGIKGMKWGRRNAESVAREKSAKKSSEPHEDHTTVKELRTKSVPSLSNGDLKKINERLQLEKTYKELSQNTSSVAKGRKRVDGVLRTANTAQQVFALYNSPMVKAVKDNITKLK